MNEKTVDVLVSVGGMLVIVAIYALVNYIMIRKWDARDKEMLDRMFPPIPPEPVKRGGPTPVA